MSEPKDNPSDIQDTEATENLKHDTSPQVSLPSFQKQKLIFQPETTEEVVEDVAEQLGIAAILSNNHVLKEEDKVPATKTQKEIDNATNEMVMEIENFEMNSMPPSLKLARMHRDCNKIGQALDYRSVKSVSSSKIDSQLTISRKKSWKFAHVAAELNIHLILCVRVQKISRIMDQLFHFISNSQNLSS